MGMVWIVRKIVGNPKRVTDHDIVTLLNYKENCAPLTFAKRAELFKFYHFVKINFLLFSGLAQKFILVKSIQGVIGCTMYLSFWIFSLYSCFPHPHHIVLVKWYYSIKSWARVVRITMGCDQSSVSASFPLFSPLLSYSIHSGKWKRWHQRTDVSLDSCCICDHAIHCLLFPSHMSRILMKYGVSFLISRLNVVVFYSF